MVQNNLLKLKKDNKGAAMVMVLVIILFISIIAAILMFVSYLGYQMRLMDKRGKDTFYTAETVLDEINAGLQKEASEAMAIAYNDLMQNYGVYDSTVMRSSQFYRMYIDELESRLRGETGADGTYSIATFRSWLSPEIIGNSRVDDATDRDDPNRASREYFGSYGAIVESNIGEDKPENYLLVKKESESLLIKDLKVTYVDPTGYVSIISTDIKLRIPDVSFSQSAEIPRLEKFSLIADETLAMGNTASGGSVNIKGNAYAGRMTVGRTDDDPSFLVNSDVTFASALGTTIDDMSLVICRENTVVDASYFTTQNVEFWGEDIILSSADADMDGITNLKDDLLLEGRESKAKLSGEYNGFSILTTDTSGSTSDGTTEGDSDGTVTLTPSSAIIINGQDSHLDLSGLESMTIAGRAYVQTKTKETTTDDGSAGGGTATPEEYKNKNDIMMAESVSVKSNQLIYLAPAEAIGCVIEKPYVNEDDEASGNEVVGTIGETAFGANPLTLEQYEKIINNPDDYVLLNAERNIAALGYKPLKNYINQESVMVGGEVKTQYMPEIIFKQTNNGTLVYCYLKFADEEKANQYFKDYYNVNSEQIEKYTRLYAKEIKMPDPTAMLYLNLSGNMLAYDGEDAPVSVISAPGDGSSSYYIRQKQARTMFGTKTSAFKALSAKLVTNIAQLSTLEQGRNAFENIINTTKLQEMFAASATDTIEIKTVMAGVDKYAIFTKRTNYTVNSSTPDHAIIISLGNVEVTDSFQGLIIAAGNITVKSGGTAVEIIPLDIADFAQILDAETEIDGNTYYVIDAFRDGINYKSGTSSSGSVTETVAMKDLIVYEQWTKK